MFVRSSVRQTIFKTVMFIGALFAVTVLLAAIPGHRTPTQIYVPPQQPEQGAQQPQQQEGAQQQLPQRVQQQAPQQSAHLTNHSKISNRKRRRD
jgi:hypothetical protein